jgi:hypothetical protein
MKKKRLSCKVFDVVLGLAAVLLVTILTTGTAVAVTKLTVYTALEAEELEPLRKAFRKDYPDIDINWVRDSTGIITAKILAEKNNPKADLFYGTSATSLLVADSLGLLMPYAPKGLDKLDPRFRDPRNPPHWVGVDAYAAVICYNTVEAKKTAQILNELTHHFHKVLKNHPLNIERERAGLFPANIVLCRGAGKLPRLTPLSLRYGISAVAISAMPLVKGVCKAAGMELLKVSGATGTYDTNVLAKANAAIEALRSYDFVFVHVKGTDVASHDSRVNEKVKMIEKIDRLVEHITRHVDLNKTYIALTADHTTCSRTKEHEGDPVPVVICGPEIRTDEVKEFSERACAKGGLGRIRGKDLMPIIINLLGKTRKFGA